MRFALSVLTIAALCAMPRLAAAQNGGTAELNLDGIPKTQERQAPDVKEYDSVPVGLLVPPDSETKTTEVAPATPALPQALGQMPGVYAIPGAEAQPEEDQGVLSFDQILALYKRQTYDRILQNLKPMADGGQHDAEQLLGIMYMNGQGVKQDYTEALKYLTKAAENGRPLAEHYLGVMYFKGLGLPQADSIKGLMWLHVAILHYAPGPEQERAKKDRDGAYLNMTRLEKNRALQLARDWLEPRGEAHLLDMQN